MRKLIIAAAVGVLAVVAIVWSAVHARHSKMAEERQPTRPPLSRRTTRWSNKATVCQSNTGPIRSDTRHSSAR
jgi:hypothetical protein